LVGGGTVNRRSVLLAIVLAATACSDREGSRDIGAGHGAHPISDAADGHADAMPGMAAVDVPYTRRQTIGVRSVPVERRSLVHRLRTVGLIAADERRVRTIQTKFPGWVEELYVSFTGEHVRGGQPILSVYSPDLVATQREYLLALQAARSGESAGRRLLDSARTRLLFWDLTDAQVKQLERSGAVSRTVTLHSPIGGFVTLKPVYAGMYVTPDMPLYTVTDLGTVWIWADLYEGEFDLVSLGETASFTLASSPGRTQSAVVSYVNPTMEPATRTLRIRFDVDNPEGDLRPGMYATVELDAPLGDVLALPEEAVIDTGERRVVFVEVADGRYQPREVVLGRTAEGHYEVLEGLAAGERVVVSAQFLLDSESRLRAAAGGPAHGAH
jgi:Cu(I)/Ag(I) efflux system membrane fusion protein